jgi:hypothetical protein
MSLCKSNVPPLCMAEARITNHGIAPSDAVKSRVRSHATKSSEDNQMLFAMSPFGSQTRFTCDRPIATRTAGAES